MSFPAFKKAVGVRCPIKGLRCLALAVLGTFLVGPRVQAQTKPPPIPSVLNQIAVNDEDGVTDIRLTFGPKAPTYSIVKNNSDAPAVGFALSSRAPSATVPNKLGSALGSIAFQQVDTILIFRPRFTRPVRIAVTQANSNVLDIKAVGIAPDNMAQNDDSGTLQTGPLPKAVQPAPGEGGFEVVPLKYADVSEVVGLLTNGITIKSNDSFTPNEPDFGSAGMGGNTAFNPPPPPNPAQQNEPLGQSVDQAIGVDRRLNAIILKGSPEQIARLKREIAKIDVPVKSVILETVFVEMNQTGARNIGLDFNNANSQIAVGTIQAGNFIPPGYPIGHALNSGALQAAIYAQVSAGNGQIISKPRIAAQSGSDAKIITGDALPILTSIALSGVNGVSQQVQYVNVGVTLQIAPRVSSDGNVTSHVFCVVSSVTGYSQGYPTISQRKAETSVTVHNGETFVIGGLTQKNDISNNEKIPGLGDLPLIGDLFKLEKGTNSKTELYIVVTPHIVNGNFAAVSDNRQVN